MIDFKEIDSDGENWELFARDFLEELGFYIESQPDRGADGGKDLLVTEQLQGNLNKYRFRWLVSCKHYANSNKSVTEKDEVNIQERIDSFKADGFIGFYSTLPSAALNTRMNQLKENNKIKDFRFFDGKLIENHLVRIGYSRLLLRYLPESYKSIKPKHLVFNEYIPIECDYCGKDLIENHHEENYQGIVCNAEVLNDNGPNDVIDVYFACKGDCDTALENKYWKQHKAITKWQDITDLAIPVFYLKWVMATLNDVKTGRLNYSDNAFEKTKKITLALSQIVMREMTDKERERVMDLAMIPDWA
jgi:hypothetical protein